LPESSQSPATHVPKIMIRQVFALITTSLRSPMIRSGIYGKEFLLLPTPVNW
jgi:hypothetical protein